MIPDFLFYFILHSINLVNAVSCNRSHQVKMSSKLKADYGAVLHMPVLKEGKDRPIHGGLHGHQTSTESGVLMGLINPLFPSLK